MISVTQGYEIQIDNTGKNPDTNSPSFGDPLHNTGDIYKLAGSTAVPSVGQWHTYEIEANGATITVRLDGQQVSQFKNANRSPKGFKALLGYKIIMMDRGYSLRCYGSKRCRDSEIDSHSLPGFG
jgi:hypothetical protein